MLTYARHSADELISVCGKSWGVLSRIQQAHGDQKARLCQGHSDDGRWVSERNLTQGDHIANEEIPSVPLSL